MFSYERGTPVARWPVGESVFSNALAPRMSRHACLVTWCVLASTVLSTEGRVVGLCWAQSKLKGPKGRTWRAV
jgi:hypothetical protein